MRETSEPQVRAEAMRQVNPAFIPRNHRIEQAIVAAVEHGDFEPFATLSAVLSQPYRPQERFEPYADAPQPGERIHETFCGTGSSPNQGTAPEVRAAREFPPRSGTRHPKARRSPGA